MKHKTEIENSNATVTHNCSKCSFYSDSVINITNNNIFTFIFHLCTVKFLCFPQLRADKLLVPPVPHHTERTWKDPPRLLVLACGGTIDKEYEPRTRGFRFGARGAGATARAVFDAAEVALDVEHEAVCR